MIDQGSLLIPFAAQYMNGWDSLNIWKLIFLLLVLVVIIYFTRIWQNAPDHRETRTDGVTSGSEEMLSCSKSEALIRGERVAKAREQAAARGRALVKTRKLNNNSIHLTPSENPLKVVASPRVLQRSRLGPGPQGRQPRAVAAPGSHLAPRQKNFMERPTTSSKHTCDSAALSDDVASLPGTRALNDSCGRQL